jgi:hypothetical protein
MNGTAPCGMPDGYSVFSERQLSVVPSFLEGGKMAKFVQTSARETLDGFVERAASTALLTQCSNTLAAGFREHMHGPQRSCPRRTHNPRA